MSENDRAEKNKVILRGLKKLGLEVRSGNKHDTATCPKTGKKTTIPRHKLLNKYTVGSIYGFLVSCGYAPKEIKQAFRWS